MKYDEIAKNWQSFADAIKKIGGDVLGCTIESPAKEEDIKNLEKKLKFSLPPSFRDVLLNFSADTKFCWFFPSGFELKGDLSQISSGECSWSLNALYEIDAGKNDAIKACFSNKKDDYNKVWHNKLAFQHIMNGDYLAIDLSRPGHEPVVYLSHDYSENHGIHLGENFKDFLLKASRIGCVGPEHWQMQPFIEIGKPYISPDGKNAKKLRKLLHVEI